MLLVVKCIECGKEYVLEQEEDLSEFQCKCGGDLELKKYGVQEPPKSKIPLKKISISVIYLVIILDIFLIK